MPDREKVITMSDFLLFIDDLRRRFPVHVEIYYSKIMDWCITVQKKGCADQYPKSVRIKEDAVLCAVQNSDIALAFAQAHVAVKEWLMENEGGY